MVTVETVEDFALLMVVQIVDVMAVVTVVNIIMANIIVDPIVRIAHLMTSNVDAIKNVTVRSIMTDAKRDAMTITLNVIKTVTFPNTMMNVKPDVIAKNAPIIMGEDTKVKRSIRNINASSIDTIKIFQ